MIVLLHIGLEVVILMVVIMALVRLENLQRTVDHLAGNDPEAAQPVDHPAESA